MSNSSDQADVFELCVIFWGVFLAKAKHTVSDDCVLEAMQLSVANITTNKDKLKDKEGDDYKNAKKCTKVCAKVADGLADDLGSDEITPEIFRDAFLIVSGKLTGKGVDSEAETTRPHGLICEGGGS